MKNRESFFIKSQLLMNKKSDKITAVNKRTGKTIQEMTWEEIRSLKGPRISQKELLEKLQQAHSTPHK